MPRILIAGSGSNRNEEPDRNKLLYHHATFQATTVMSNICTCQTLTVADASCRSEHAGEMLRHSFCETEFGFNLQPEFRLV